MHIPDGFIPIAQCLIYYVILIVALYFSVKWAKSNLDEKRIPLLAVLAAGIFAIMSMNMPIPFGISGHRAGGALVSIVFLAPEAAVLVFTVVLLIQALIFGDGGLTALAANVINMGIVGGAVGLYTFKALNTKIGNYPAVGIAAWLATVLAALACAIEMSIAGTFPINIGMPCMVLYHLFIGIMKAVLTVVGGAALDKFRPDLLAWNKN